MSEVQQPASFTSPCLASAGHDPVLLSWLNEVYPLLGGKERNIKF